MLWNHPGPAARRCAHAHFSNGNVYISSGYGVGCKLVNVGTATACGCLAKQGDAKSHGGVIQLGQYVYGLETAADWSARNV